MKLCLPYRGEFGFKVFFHAPQLNAIQDEKIICLEKGYEALYPRASSFFYVDTKKDEDKRAKPEQELIIEIKEKFKNKNQNQNLEFVEPNRQAPRKYFTPLPYKYNYMYDKSLNNDVVICPRKRKYGEDKNLEIWPKIAKLLLSDNVNFIVAGTKNTSYDTPGKKVWDIAEEYEDLRILDATIAAIHKSKIVVATDNGLAHLAVAIGKPVLMITHENGLVAPGKDDRGRPYWPVIIKRYNEENHKNVEINLLHRAWFDACFVKNNILKFLEKYK